MQRMGMHVAYHTLHQFLCAFYEHAIRNYLRIKRYLWIVHKKHPEKLNKTKIVAKKRKLIYNSNGHKIANRPMHGIAPGVRVRFL